jgi:hypothetical protein
MMFASSRRRTGVAPRGRSCNVKILSRLCTSLDGCVSTVDGRPIQLAYPAWDADQLGFYELQSG